MNQIIFFDIRFQTSMGDDVEITTMDVQKAASLYSQFRNMKNFRVFKRIHKFDCEDDIECDITDDIMTINAQWREILSKVQR